MRYLLPLALLLTLVACGSQSDTASDLKEPLKTYDLKGQIVALDDSGTVKIAKIKHEAIGDWMGAMTMEFPVLEQDQFAKLKEGEKITGKVYVRGLTFWAGDFQEAPAEDEAAPAAKSTPAAPAASQ